MRISNTRFYLFLCLMLCLYKGGGWFRVFGCGLAWKDTKIHTLLFSERNGYGRGFYIGKWRFKFLKGDK